MEKEMIGAPPRGGIGSRGSLPRRADRVRQVESTRREITGDATAAEVAVAANADGTASRDARSAVRSLRRKASALIQAKTAATKAGLLLQRAQEAYPEELLTPASAGHVVTTGPQPATGLPAAEPTEAEESAPKANQAVSPVHQFIAGWFYLMFKVVLVSAEVGVIYTVAARSIDSDLPWHSLERLPAYCLAVAIPMVTVLTAETLGTNLGRALRYPSKKWRKTQWAWVLLGAVAAIVGLLGFYNLVASRYSANTLTLGTPLPGNSIAAILVAGTLLLLVMRASMKPVEPLGKHLARAEQRCTKAEADWHTAAMILAAEIADVSTRVRIRWDTDRDITHSVRGRQGEGPRTDTTTALEQPILAWAKTILAKHAPPENESTDTAPVYTLTTPVSTTPVSTSSIPSGMWVVADPLPVQLRNGQVSTG